MKRGFFIAILVFCSGLVMTGCIKNTPYVTTINPYLTATIGTYNFTSTTVVPSTIDTQAHDSVQALIITGNTSDLVYVNDKIILEVTKFKNKTATYSIVQGQAGAAYVHSGINDVAVGGIVAITKITDNSLIGYFSFQTASGVLVSNGTFSVGNPWYFY